MHLRRVIPPSPLGSSSRFVVCVGDAPFLSKTVIEAVYSDFYCICRRTDLNSRQVGAATGDQDAERWFCTSPSEIDG
jgi:hypothetical protein